MTLQRDVLWEFRPLPELSLPAGLRSRIDVETWSKSIMERSIFAIAIFGSLCTP